MTHARVLDPVTNPQPVDDDLLDPGEYEEACEEARARTAARIMKRIDAMEPDEAARYIEGTICENEPALAAMLAATLTVKDDPTAANIAHVVRSAMYRHMETETRSVDPEEVLAEWHEPPDTAYDIRKQQQLDATAGRLA